MSLMWNIPNKNKWIRGVTPPVQGNYLVAFLKPDEDISQLYRDLRFGAYLNRLTYNPSNNCWFTKEGIVSYRDVKIPVNSNFHYDLLWWDEYGFFDQPRKLKIKFPKNDP